MKNVQGFTLIELMIVVAIIAILAAIALPAYQDYVVRSQVSEGSVLADGAKTAVAEFYSNKGYLPPNNASAGLAAAASIRGNYVTTLTVSNGAGATIVANYGNQANSLITNKHLAFSASTLPGSVAWKCTNATTTVLPKYLPTICRS
jgi:type IV pilus assembly protein PilA